MYRLRSISIGCTLLLAFVATSNASPVTESYSGNGILVTPGNTGNHGSDAYSILIIDSQAFSTISYELEIRTIGSVPDSGNNTGLHFDFRGFGDTGGINDAFQTTPTTEMMALEIKNLQIEAAPGFTVVSDTINVQFNSFDVVNNGRNAASVSWVDNTGVSGVASLPTGGSGLTATATGMSSAANLITLTPVANWMWINNIQTQFSGDVVLESGVTGVPEPSAGIMSFGVVVGLITSRRKRD